MGLKNLITRPVNSYRIRCTIVYEDGTTEEVKETIQSVHDADWVRDAYTVLLSPGAERSIAVDTESGGTRTINLRLVRSIETTLWQIESETAERKLRLVGATEFDREASRWMDRLGR